jgi:prepilin-type N-terminal cleavage/methylation domain-containing protein/prepilin-type processing-associated H-X9-DG protein
MSTWTGHRRAFTLMELLVVVGIIGILVAILVPALAMAKSYAALAACKSNVANLAKANNVYAESEGAYILAAEDMMGDNTKRWFGERDEVNGEFTPGGLATYMPGLSVGACPLFDQVLDTAGQDAAFEAGCGAYGYNDMYIGRRKGDYTRSATPAQVTNGAETVMFADCAYLRDGEMMAYSFTHAPMWVPARKWGSKGPNPPIHFRHGGKAAVGWADGHATAEELSYSGAYSVTNDVSSGAVQDLELGWFGRQYDSLPDANYLFDLD